METAADIECGYDGCEIVNDACVPIAVSRSDSAFSGQRCLEFVRSQSVPSLNCSIGKTLFLKNDLLLNKCHFNNISTTYPQHYLIWIFTHFKWVKIILNSQNGVNDFEILLIDITF